VIVYVKKKQVTISELNMCILPDSAKYSQKNLIAIDECIIDLAIQSPAIKSLSRHATQFPRVYVSTREGKREIISQRNTTHLPVFFKATIERQNGR